MGLFTYTLAGGAVILIGLWESLTSASESVRQTSSPFTSPRLNNLLPQNFSRHKPKPTSFSSTTTTYILIAVLSLAFIVNSCISLFDAVGSKDDMGFALQLQVITTGLLFLLNSVLGILTNTKDSIRFPAKLLNLIYAFAFGLEFLLFYIQSKDTDGVENRYYDLILVPIAICLFSTLLELEGQKSAYARLGRGIGFVLQGTWTLQMGFSFYSNLIANGCALYERSRGNYTIKCKGHPEYHRSGAIATLQFNCHLALLVTMTAVVYSVFCKIHGINKEVMSYKPLGVGDGGDMHLENQPQFTLDSDNEDEEAAIKEVRNVEMQNARVVAHNIVANGSDP